jgi:hypothetical protein
MIVYKAGVRRSQRVYRGASFNFVTAAVNQKQWFVGHPTVTVGRSTLSVTPQIAVIAHCNLLSTKRLHSTWNSLSAYVWAACPHNFTFVSDLRCLCRLISELQISDCHSGCNYYSVVFTLSIILFSPLLLSDYLHRCYSRSVEYSKDLGCYYFTNIVTD